MAEIPLDEDMDSTAMAEAMGFSGFGMQPGAKKRKFNPHADASVSGLPKKPSAAGSRNTTGANSAPLGQRSLPPPSASLPSRPPIAAVAGSTGNAEEIDLDDDENGVGAVDRDVQVPAGLEEADDDPRYLDTSRPSRGYIPEDIVDMEAQVRPGHQISSQANAAGLSQKPQVPRHAQNQRQSGRRMRGSDQNADDQPWWEGYYDAKMNQNPWERLEKQRGLEPRGTWLTRHTNANAGPSETETVQGPKTVDEGGQEIPDVEAGDEP